MAAPYVTAALILAHVREDSPSAEQTAWAETCADALEAVIARRLSGVTVSAELEAELIRAGTQDGAAAYDERDAPHGVQAIGPDGDIVRYGRSITRALEPIFAAYSPGIA